LDPEITLQVRDLLEGIDPSFADNLIAADVLYNQELAIDQMIEETNIFIDSHEGSSISDIDKDIQARRYRMTRRRLAGAIHRASNAKNTIHRQMDRLEGLIAINPMIGYVDGIQFNRMWNTLVYLSNQQIIIINGFTSLLRRTNWYYNYFVGAVTLDTRPQEEGPQWMDINNTVSIGDLRRKLSTTIKKNQSSVRNAVLQNEAYLRVLRTSPTMQLTAMHIPFGGEIPLEKHDDTTQMLHIMQGAVTVNASDPKASGYGFPGDYIMINPGVRHHIIAGHARTVTLPDGTSTKAVLPVYDPKGGDLKLLSIYAPPVHPSGRVIQEYPGKNKMYPTIKQ
jgi:quercetin dioxygenase-like cupin family protein